MSALDLVWTLAVFLGAASAWFLLDVGIRARRGWVLAVLAGGAALWVFAWAMAAGCGGARGC